MHGLTMDWIVDPTAERLDCALDPHRYWTTIGAISQVEVFRNTSSLFI